MQTTEQTGNGGTKDVQAMVSLKYLSIFEDPSNGLWF